MSLEAPDGRVDVVRPRIGRRCSWKKRRVVRVLDRWREVRLWWDQEHRKDRLLFRVLLSGDIIVDLALERSGEWFLVGVVD